VPKNWACQTKSSNSQKRTGAPRANKSFAILYFNKDFVKNYKNEHEQNIAALSIEKKWLRWLATI
jgi:hypothetical protein